MKQTNQLTLGLMAVSALFITSCDFGAKKDDNTAALGLMYLALNNGKTSEQVAGTSQVGVSAATSSIATSATTGVSGCSSSCGDTGQLAANIPSKFQKMDMKTMARQIASMDISKRNPALRNVAASLTASGSGSTLKISGTVDCSPSGTVTLTNVAFGLQYSGSISSTYSFKSYVSGPFTFNNCYTTGTDWTNFPAKVYSTLTGKVDVVNKQNQTGTIVKMTSTPTASGTSLDMESNLTYLSKGTIKSDALNADGQTSTLDVTTDINLTAVNTKASCLQTSTATTMSMSCNYVDVITGTVNTTGKVNGNTIAKTKTYSNETFNYTVKISCTQTSCSIN